MSTLLTIKILLPLQLPRLRDLHEDKVPVNRVSTPLNSRHLRVERSRNPAGWDTLLTRRSLKVALVSYDGYEAQKL
jgi:hypothetical protein